MSPAKDSFCPCGVYRPKGWHLRCTRCTFYVVVPELGYPVPAPGVTAEYRCEFCRGPIVTGLPLPPDRAASVLQMDRLRQYLERVLPHVDVGAEADLEHVVAMAKRALEFG